MPASDKKSNSRARSHKPVVIGLGVVGVILLGGVLWLFIRGQQVDNRLRMAMEHVSVHIPSSWVKTKEYWSGSRKLSFLDIDTSVRNYAREYTGQPSTKISKSILQQSSATRISCDNFENRTTCSGTLQDACVYIIFASNSTDRRPIKLGMNLHGYCSESI